MIRRSQGTLVVERHFIQVVSMREAISQRNSTLIGSFDRSIPGRSLAVMVPVSLGCLNKNSYKAIVIFFNKLSISDEFMWYTIKHLQIQKCYVKRAMIFTVFRHK